MPDISMCAHAACPLSAQCYRHVAKPSPRWQSYAEFPAWWLTHAPTCEHWWPLESSTQPDL